MFSGSLVAIITPMHPNGEVDFTGLDKLIEYQIANGTNGIVATGTTGESATLTPNEHIAVIEHVYKQVNGRCKVIAGTGSNSTAETIIYSKAAEKIGVDACLLCVPYYNKPTQEGLYQHFKTIADQISTPILLYNVPGRTVADLSAETTNRLAEIDNIVGIKEANNIERIRELIDVLDGKIDVLTGDDPTIVDTIAHGGQGVISVTANIAPKQVAEMCELALAGNIDSAREREKALMPLHHLLFIESNPIPVKWAAAKMGFSELGIRLPLTPLSETHHAALEQSMREHDLL